MNTLETYIYVSCHDIEQVWLFLFKNKYRKQERDELIQVAQVSKQEFINAGLNVLDMKITELEASIPERYVCLHRRIEKLKHMHKDTEQFKEEAIDIKDSLVDYKELERKVGFHRATRYMMSNRIANLIERQLITRKICGYIINDIDKRENFDLNGQIQNVIDEIRDEFE